MAPWSTVTRYTRPPKKLMHQWSLPAGLSFVCSISIALKKLLKCPLIFDTKNLLDGSCLQRIIDMSA
jgi:hypothetical protein